jgi:purine-binding chemotaxis protein CheW
MAVGLCRRHRPKGGEKFVVIFDLAKLMANDEIPGGAGAEAPRAA